MRHCRTRGIARLLRRLLTTSNLQPTVQKSAACGTHEPAPRCRYACHLTHRALVRVEGEEGCSFLQGFMTADMEEERGEREELSYSMMLNAQGRVLFDVLIYQLMNNSYYLECASDLRNDVINHLRKYALRAKMKFSSVDDHLVWALFPGQPVMNSSDPQQYTLHPDPRYSPFGSRVILPLHISASNLWPNLETTDIGTYHDHRLSSGIPEGTDDIISGRSLPLECNLDFMNGVSFSKGCYLGQELTARTHHTGITRKRLMPVSLNQIPSSPIPSGTAITSSGGTVRAGKLLEHRGHHGLALMKLRESRKGGMTVRDDSGNEISVTAHVPDYWPELIRDKDEQ